MVKIQAALVLVVSVAALSASCVADVADEPIGDAVEPGIRYGTGKGLPPADPMQFWLDTHRGPCAEACYAASRTDRCAWQDGCETDPYDEVHCGGAALTCDEARAAENGVVGVATCWRRCESLH